MKNQLISLLVIILFTSCHSLKKVQTDSTTTDSIKTETHTTLSKIIDTSKIINTITQMVTIVYDPTCDSARVTINGNTYTGHIKSATTTTTTHTIDKKGITKTAITADKVKIQKITTKIQTKTDIAKDPYRWRWIFGIVIVLAIIIFIIYLQLKPATTTLKPLQFITNLFKK